MAHHNHFHFKFQCSATYSMQLAGLSSRRVHKPSSWCLASAIFSNFKHSFAEEGRELKQGQLCGVLSTWIKGTALYVWTHLKQAP